MEVLHSGDLFADHAAPSASECSFIFATMRARGFMPQSVLSVNALGRNGREDLPDASGDLLRRFDRVGADIEHADLDVLVLRKVLQELDAGHVAIGVIEHELVDAWGVEEIRQHGLVALGVAGAQDVVAPSIAEAEVPADLRIDAIAALLDDFRIHL